MITMLDFIKDIFSAFKQNSIERIRNPFIGAFVFSWLGFNWKALAILFLSDKDITKRISYINETHDVGSFLLGPICTTILICWILPEINKFFTRLQNKPNSETTEIIMQSKIDIAEKQLQIADIEAKKKLAIKREERNIEEGVESIKKEIGNEIEKNKEMTIKIDELSASLKQSGLALNSTNLSLLSAEEKIASLADSLENSSKILNKKTEEILEMRKEIAILSGTIENFKDANKSMAKEYEHIFHLSGDRLTVRGSALSMLKEINVDDIPF